MRSRLLSLLPLLTVVAACGTTTAINNAVDKVQAVPAVEVGSVAVGVDTAVVAGALALSPPVSLFGYAPLSAPQAALFYVIYDPLAPNWRIEERRLDATTFQFALRAKNFRTGGDGEAIQVLKRRAMKLQREQGYAGYRILEYSEGIESATPFSYRVSAGTIELVQAGANGRK